VKIAYCVNGEGPPLIHMAPMPFSHVRKEWTHRQTRRYYEELGGGLQLIRYDCRGAGLSDRNVTDYTSEAHARDILAVAERLGLERFALLGFGHSGTVAIQFAARHPHLVSHLVLWCAYPRAADYGQAPRVRAMRALMDEDWDFFTRAEGFQLSQYEGGETSNYFVEWVRESITKEAYRSAIAELRKLDVTALMPAVQAPTLVLHRTGLASITVEMAKEIAATIPNARLMLVEGEWISPSVGGTKEIVAAIRDLVREVSAPAPQSTVTTSPAVLTPRETEVLRLVASGMTSREISDRLSLSVRTVGRHITNIYTKIGARTRADATAYAIRHHIA
jgi:pimeloyl-ACP methyl ester carboxylesterase/DNA-binding CsgD family transcriptional regulator